MENRLRCDVGQVIGDFEVAISASTLGMDLRYLMLASNQNGRSTYETLWDTLASEVREVIDSMVVCGFVVGEQSITDKNDPTLKKEGTIGAYTLGSVGVVNKGTVRSGVVSSH